MFKKIGLVKESESPENPGALEKRVAVVPKDLARLVQAGCEVFVETGAGEGVGFSDEEYLKAGAQIQTVQEIYRDKDLVIKFKGPSLEAIPQMRRGCALFCMAHFHSYPDRAQALIEQGIKVIAMEEILESPKQIPDEVILSKRMVRRTLENLIQEGISPEELHIHFLGYSPKLVGGIRRAGNRNSHTLQILQESITREEIQQLGSEHFGDRGLFFYDSRGVSIPPQVIRHLHDTRSRLIDLAQFEEEHGKKEIEEFHRTHEPFEFGLRRIQCLHETGMAGARYGYRLALEESQKVSSAEQVRAVVLGYGNVGMGAIDECYRQGSRVIRILTRRTTAKGVIEGFLKQADVVVNGAEQPRELRGKNYLITREHAKRVLEPGSVVIDLIGGSEVNRSPVENILQCTFLTDPYFVEDGIYFSALWGWPMMGMMRETAMKYSSQIVEVLLGRERLIEGLEGVSAGVKRALVNCPPLL